jgi:hypothetical protein
VAKFKQIKITRTKKLMSRMSGGRACRCVIHNASSLLSKNLNVQSVMLPAVLYGCETWSDNLREENTVFFFFTRYNFSSLNFLAFSTYNIIIFTILDAVSPILYFRFFMSFLMSSSHLFFYLPSGILNTGFHLYTFTILSSGIRCKWPNQLNFQTPCVLYIGRPLR